MWVAGRVGWCAGVGSPYMSGEERRNRLNAMVFREARVRGIAPPSARGRLTSFGPLVLVRLVVLLLQRRVVFVIEPVTLLVLMRGHVPRQVVPFPEALVAYRTPELVHVPPLLGVHANARTSHAHPTDTAAYTTAGADAATSVATLVVRPHVVHQIRRHAEANVTLGAHVLRR